VTIAQATLTRHARHRDSRGVETTSRCPARRSSSRRRPRWRGLVFETSLSVGNRAGRWTQPTLGGIKAAGKAIKHVAANNSGISIVDPARSNKFAYPICTFTYVIVPTTSPKAADLKRFITWALTKGQADGPPLLFSPLPKVVLKASLKTIALVHT
jgi:hypothetical protein